MTKQSGAYLPATTTSRLKWKCPECDKQTGQSINQFQVMTILASNNSQVLAFSTATAKLLGDMAAAIILQQIHYWTEKENCGRIFDGVRWIYKSYKQWQEDFSWMSIHQIRRCIGILRSFGVVKVEQWTKHNDDKNCYWYTVDYETLDALLAEESTSKPYRTTCAQKRTTPAESDTSPVESGTLSIYKKNTNKEFSSSDNNSSKENAADLMMNFFSEEKDSEEDKSESYPIDKVEVRNKVKEPIKLKDRGDAGRDNNNLLVLQTYGFELNKQLRKLAAKYSAKEIKRSLEYLEERKLNAQDVQNELGWLTECLKDGWWQNSLKSKEEATVRAELEKGGFDSVEIDIVLEQLWQMVDGNYIEALPVLGDSAQIGNYLYLKESFLFVLWSGLNTPDEQGQLHSVVLTPWDNAIEAMQDFMQEMN